jgi:maleylpyruvate isomerase
MTTTDDGDAAAVAERFAADLERLTTATDALLATAASLRDEDLGAPSLCDGWTRGHVLAHLSRNADALVRLVRWAATGAPEEMYPGGAPAREAEIDAGAGRPVADQVADLRGSAVALGAAFERLRRELRTGGPSAPVVEGRGGHRMAAADLPFVRLREVVYHHADLDAGFSLEDVDERLLARFLDDAVGRLSLSRRAPALVLLAGPVASDRDGEAEARWEVAGADRDTPPVVVRGSRAALLLWLARRRADGIRSDGPLPELPRGA